MNKREIATYGTHLEADLTNIDWGKEVFKRAPFKGNQSADLSRKYLMIEDDMSFMEPIFREGKLPFAEYLVTSGYHPMTQEILSRKTQDFTDEEAHEGAAKLSALDGMMDKYGLHFAATYRFPCKGGASISVSVISGKMFYSRIDAPYEVMGVALDDEDGDHPRGYQTDEQLMIYLAKVVAKAQEY